MDWGVAPVEALDPQMPTSAMGKLHVELARACTMASTGCGSSTRRTREVGCRVSGFRVLGE